MARRLHRARATLWTAPVRAGWRRRWRGIISRIRLVPFFLLGSLYYNRTLGTRISLFLTGYWEFHKTGAFFPRSGARTIDGHCFGRPEPTRDREQGALPKEPESWVSGTQINLDHRPWELESHYLRNSPLRVPIQLSRCYLACIMAFHVEVLITSYVSYVKHDAAVGLSGRYWIYMDLLFRPFGCQSV